MVATREDNPISSGVAFWNDALSRFDTSTGFTFTPAQGLRLPIASNQPSEMTILTWDGALVGSRDLGTMAFETSTNYYNKTMVDGKFTNVDTSLNNIWTKLGSVDTSLANLGIWINELSTNKLDALASTTGTAGTVYPIYAGEDNNVAYIKQLAAGAGTTISADGSIITIAVGGTTGVQKYRGTFDGTTTSSFTISAITHTLGTGPFTVSVYENNVEVYTNVTLNGSGDVILSWAPGSLTDASCKFIISG